ncbi:hypothetical protein JQ594_01220 [Bradyrhizobium manausense]|uniref:hypothetical protein n=1 Tax=Bradyrhizobium manausense TaxID=989370 RepID=UPI001BA9C337|nr:hypothetical protein [Bradyrhizobium manausense]MBR0684520.1 hypothetical protein [Bradyrhizobium manausense]
MSHFLCGEIVFRETGEPGYSEALFLMIEASAKLRLCVQFGVNVIQKIVFDILGSKPNRIELDRLPFFVVGSPIANTSDEIFYPPTEQFSPNERASYLTSKIDDLIAWVRIVSEAENTIGMTIYFSEGYDTNYKHESCTLEEFPRTMYRTLLPPADVPSTKISIEWAE